MSDTSIAKSVSFSEGRFSNRPLSRALIEYQNWLRYDAIPYWLDNGITPTGGHAEQLLSNGAIDESANSRTRVQFRQISVVSLAHSLGWLNEANICIDNICGYLDRHASLKTDNGQTKPGQKIYVHTLNSLGEIIDQKQDLYDLAFQLLSYACRYFAFSDIRFLAAADRLYQRLDRELACPHGGWLEGNYAYQYRRQNPHMHMFEALLALHQASGNEIWLARADKIYRLFEMHFLDAHRNLLLEYFQHNWSAANDTLQVVEPGHMLEWVWLLRQYQTVSGVDVDETCNRLYQMALQYVHNSSNLLFNKLSTSGEIIDSNCRCWIITEWIKASLAQASFASDAMSNDYQADALQAMRTLTTHYLNHPKTGQYFDELDQDLNRVSEHTPASTLYHLMMLNMECHRFLQQNLKFLTPVTAPAATEATC